MRSALRAGLVAGLLICAGGCEHGARPLRDAVATAPPAPRPPSLVLVLMDDFSLDLVQTMRHAQGMQRRGASYRHAFVVDSLCCVSRTSILTGQYPHQHGVLTNTANLPNRVGPIGGWAAFRANGNLLRSFNVQLERAGYTTGFVGKYLNEYLPTHGGRPAVQPRGWTEFTAILRSAYNGWSFEYTSTEDGRLHLRHHPAPPPGASDAEKDRAYADSFAQRRALGFIERHAAEDTPYFLEVATYGPHSRVGPVGHYAGDPMFPPAFRDRSRAGRRGGNCGAVRCGDLTVADLTGFGDDPADNAPLWSDLTPAPAWRAPGPPVPPRDAVASLRDRARMVQSIDRMLGRILGAVDANTYVVLTADNGFHLGQGGLGVGKGTPYASDVRVPLVVTGPGVVPGVRDDVVTSVDLAPTFEELAGVPSPAYRFGESLAPSLRDPAVTPHGYAFFEHTWSPSLGGNDPDRWYAGDSIDVIPSYVAVRSRLGLLVRLDLDPGWHRQRFAWEYYDYRDAPYERTNAYADPAKRADVQRHTRALRRFLACSSATRGSPVTPRCRAVTRP